MADVSGAAAQAGGSTGDEPSDDELFVRLYPALQRFAAAVRPPHVEADDLVQEAVARTLRSRHRLADLDDPAAYLRRAVLRIASNERRGWRRARNTFARVAHTDVHVDSEPSDLAVLALVDPADRAVLYLRAIEGRSYTDVAAVLGCTEEAARTRAARARRRLRDALAKDEP